MINISKFLGSVYVLCELIAICVSLILQTSSTEKILMCDLFQIVSHSWFEFINNRSYILC